MRKVSLEKVQKIFLSDGSIIDCIELDTVDLESFPEAISWLFDKGFLIKKKTRLDPKQYITAPSENLATKDQSGHKFLAIGCWITSNFSFDIAEFQIKRLSPGVEKQKLASGVFRINDDFRESPLMEMRICQVIKKPTHNQEYSRYRYKILYGKSDTCSGGDYDRTILIPKMEGITEKFWVSEDSRNPVKYRIIIPQ